MPLFDRYIEVSVGEEGRQGISIDALKISAKIEKTESSDPNVCTLSIWNANENTRRLLESNNLKMIVRAGYLESKNNVGTVFVGDVQEVSTTFQAPDIITTITAKDGEKALRNSTYSKSFSEGSKGLNILDDVVKSFKLAGQKAISKLGIGDKPYNQGFSFSGLSKNVMDKLGEYMGFDWSIQNEEIKITPKNQSDGNLTTLIDADSGMIGSPEKIKIKQGTGRDIDGWKVVSLLQGKLEPKNRVVVNSRQIKNGTFIIRKITHNIDNYESDFLSVMEVYE